MKVGELTKETHHSCGLRFLPFVDPGMEIRYPSPPITLPGKALGKGSRRGQPLSLRKYWQSAVAVGRQMARFLGCQLADLPRPPAPSATSPSATLRHSPLRPLLSLPQGIYKLINNNP